MAVVQPQISSTNILTQYLDNGFIIETRTIDASEWTAITYWLSDMQA
jgi:hypothetical protein